MKKTIFIILLFLLVSCNSEKVPDCFKKEGTIIQTEFAVDSFNKIIVFSKIQLFVEEGPEQKVMVETGENILSDIDISVTDGTLNLVNNIGCNLVRDYGITKVYVTSPNIEEIRNSSSFSVNSIGVLSFPELHLFSDAQIDDEEGYYTNGDFSLDLNVENLTITANGLSNFLLIGNASHATIGLYAGDSRVEAANLSIGDLNIYHRSTNKMIVNPQNSIKGEIRGLGDVISKNHPPIVDVEEFYTGKLIFE